MVQRMLGPGAKTATELSREVRVHQATLSRWLRQASTLRGMERDKPPAPTPAAPKARTAPDQLRPGSARAASPPRGVERHNPPAPTPAAPKVRTAQDKLRVVLAAAACSPDELGAL